MPGPFVASAFIRQLESAVWAALLRSCSADGRLHAAISPAALLSLSELLGVWYLLVEAEK